MSDKNTVPISQTDWERLEQMSDDEIDYSDIPPLDESFFANAKLRSERKRQVSLQLNGDVVDWFARHDDNYKQLMSAVLEQYVSTQKQVA